MQHSLPTWYSNMDGHLLQWVARVENSAKPPNVFINSAPRGLEKEFIELFTNEAVAFLVELVNKFEDKVNRLYADRFERKSRLLKNPQVPKFKELELDHNTNWRVAPVSARLKNRHLDLGDVSPSKLTHFTAALGANVQGIQVDFDDGHCPTWFNQISGLHNVLKAVHNRLEGVPVASKMPVLMLRPRAWNMIEVNVSVNGRQVPGPLFDFAQLIYHNGKDLELLGNGPCFYLSKLESSEEAKLWNDIFSWAEARLSIPHGTIKACVLIENILASFEMEKILYELRDHSLGLNCGIWDYAASIIAKFGDQRSFLLPDRNKYVNMNKTFLIKYMQLVIKVCHRRGAHATGGMAAALLPPKEKFEEYSAVLNHVCKAKMLEIQQGVDGFMVYDINLVAAMNLLWEKNSRTQPNQIDYPGTEEPINEADLLCLPEGGVTMRGLKHNIRVAVLFIYHWLNGQGHFVLDGCVEDSATAEISRSQIWQWIRHHAKLEDFEGCVTRQLIQDCTQSVLEDLLKFEKNPGAKKQFPVAVGLFFGLVNRRDFPEFITTYIYNEYSFTRTQSHL